ncbi:4-alpha-glucanotransferase, partial [Streptomyces glaucescens]|uniref:4-alpha-glucanotransferase n=1 Tax=Streptomyces glaucescens TaxID=1907 RepID=UPI000D19E3EC
SWGMGDLGDLGELTAWAGRALGAGFIQVNPLHAAVPGAPTDPSPYRPSSRRFPDPVHLRIEDVPEYAHAVHGPGGERLRALPERAARLREAVLEKGELIDRDAVWDLKREALELLCALPLGPGRQAAYSDFLAEQGQALEDHATWCALAEVYGTDWRNWPAGLRDPRSPQTARARAGLMDRVDLHCRLAWLTDSQLTAAQRTAREAGMPIGIVHDLAVGVHPSGADAWAQQEYFAAGMSVGAPPDAFNARGQDWGLPPWRPDRLAATGYAPYRALLRGLFRYAGALRIDHVMGLFRLWWVPQGLPPTEGTYVRYDVEAMLAVLVLEASRAGAVVIGEDLGTVEPGVRERLRERGVLGTSVLWFERDWDGDGRPLPPEAWRADCLATATTHDLPPTAARLTGEHVDLRDRLGLLARPVAD